MNTVALHKMRCKKHKMADIAGFHPCTLAGILPAYEDPSIKENGRRRGIRFSILRIVAVIGLAASIGAATFAIGNIGTTLSYFSDTEQSLANILEAVGLGFIVDDGNNQMALTVSPGDLGTNVDTNLQLEQYSDPLTYRIFANQSLNQSLMSDAVFCNALKASTTSDLLPYNGPLKTLATATTTTTGAWPFTLSYQDSPNISEGDTCVLDLVYKGWNPYASEGVGYNDEERVTLTITAGAAPEEDLEAPQLFRLASFKEEEISTDTDISEDATTTDDDTNTPPDTDTDDTPSNDESDTTDATPTDTIDVPPSDNATTTGETETVIDDTSDNEETPPSDTPPTETVQETPPADDQTPPADTPENPPADVPPPDNPTPDPAPASDTPSDAPTE
jgi:hypothetical protein